MFNNLYKILMAEPMVVGMAVPGQYGFQPAYSPIMEGIVDLHHYICFYLILILAFVSWMLFLTIYLYRYDIRLAMYKHGDRFLNVHLKNAATVFPFLEIPRAFIATTIFSVLKPISYKVTKRLAH